MQIATTFQLTRFIAVGYFRDFRTSPRAAAVAEAGARLQVLDWTIWLCRAEGENARADWLQPRGERRNVGL